AAAPEQLREMDAVPLATREVAHALLLVGASEVEPGDVLARVHLLLAQLDDVLVARDLLPDRVLRRQVGARLVDVGELDRLADPERAAVGLLFARDHPEERCLAGAVRADHTDDATGWERERHV